MRPQEWHRDIYGVFDCTLFSWSLAIQLSGSWGKGICFLHDGKQFFDRSYRGKVFLNRWASLRGKAVLSPVTLRISLWICFTWITLLSMWMESPCWLCLLHKFVHTYRRDCLNLTCSNVLQRVFLALQGADMLKNLRCLKIFNESAGGVLPFLNALLGLKGWHLFWRQQLGLLLLGISSAWSDESLIAIFTALTFEPICAIVKQSYALDLGGEVFSGDA